MKHLKDIQSLLEELEMLGIGRGGKIESWVNVKIDNELHLRISRYVRSLESYLGIDDDDLLAKLDVLSKPSNYDYGAQCQLSIMILLQYLKEIKSNFDGSSSGFLFEDYIAGLLHGKKISGNKDADYKGSDGKNYQIKFLSPGSAHQITIKSSVFQVTDVYIIGIKRNEVIDIYIYKYKDISKYIYEFGKHFRIDFTSIKNNETPNYVLKFNNIDIISKKAAKGLREFVEKLYNEISNLHYNIETIITGVDQENNAVGIQLDEYYGKIEGNLKNIGDNVVKVKKKIIRNVTKKFK